MAVIIRNISIVILVVVPVLALSVFWGRCSSHGHKSYYGIRDVGIYSDLELILNCLGYLEGREEVSGILDSARGENINSRWLFNVVEEHCGHVFSYTFIEFNQGSGKLIDDLGNPIVVVYFGDETAVADSSFKDLSEIYKAVAWTTDVNGSMQDGVFLGLTRDEGLERRRY